MPPVVLSKEQKLKILLKSIGEYITNDIRNQRIYQSWISGDKFFYHLHESENINRYQTYSIFFYPIRPDLWHFKIDKRTVVNLDEEVKTLIDIDFFNNIDKTVNLIMRLPKSFKIVDAIDNMYQTRLNQNPKYRTIQHQMAIEGTLKNSKEFLDKYYNPELKEKHNAWKLRKQQWVKNNPIEALYALSRRKKKLISKGIAKPEDFGITNLPEDFVIPDFEKERLDKIKETQIKREAEIKEELNKKLNVKKEIALKKLQEQNEENKE